MFRFFKHRLPARKFKNSSSTETPVGPGRPTWAWVRTDYNLASVSSKGRKFGVRPVPGKRRTDWTLGNTAYIPTNFIVLQQKLDPHYTEPLPNSGGGIQILEWEQQTTGNCNSLISIDFCEGIIKFGTE